MAWRRFAKIVEAFGESPSPEPGEDKNRAENRAHSHGSKQQTEAAGSKAKFLQPDDGYQRRYNGDKKSKKDVAGQHHLNRGRIPNISDCGRK